MNDFLKQDMSNYSDERVINIIKQAQNFDPSVVNHAKQLAVERKLYSPEEIINLPRIIQLEKLALSQIHLQYSPELIKQNLSNSEPNEALVLKAMNGAARSVVIADGFKNKGGKNDGEISPWTVLFIVFIVARLVIFIIRVAK